MIDVDPKAITADSELKGLDGRALGSAALVRLIEEVRNTPAGVVDLTAYNRTYHRHNR